MKATYKEFTVSATYTGSKASPWDENNYNHHLVTVYDRETRKRTAFDFWASIANPEEYDVLNALYCFVNDGVSGMETFADFCRELGYDEDSRKAWKTWKACRKSLDKFKRISGYSDAQICDLLNEMSENYG